MWVQGNSLEMRGTSFRNADMTFSVFLTSFFGGIDFTGANLRGADFFGSKLEEIDFTDANLEGALFDDTDLFALTFSDDTICPDGRRQAEFEDCGLFNEDDEE